MPGRLAVAVIVLAGALSAANAASTQPQPSLPDLLKLVGDYHAEYGDNVSGTTLEEQYQLINITGDRMRSPVRISSDVVLVNANDGVAALRDIFAIDAKPTREHTPRITSLLASPAATLKDWATVVRIPSENAVFFAIDIIVKVNEPVTAMRFIAYSAQARLKYKLDGKKKINGVQTVGVGFDEPAARDRKYLLGTRRNGRASGRIWVDPANGAIHQTELWVESKGESANVTVKFAPHPELNLILPVATTETYEERELSSAPGASAGSGVAWHNTFQASAKYSNATYQRIDLRKLKR